MLFEMLQCMIMPIMMLAIGPGGGRMNNIIEWANHNRCTTEKRYYLKIHKDLVFSNQIEKIYIIQSSTSSSSLIFLHTLPIVLSGNHSSISVVHDDD